MVKRWLVSPAYVAPAVTRTWPRPDGSWRLPSETERVAFAIGSSTGGMAAARMSASLLQSPAGSLLSNRVPP